MQVTQMHKVWWLEHGEGPHPGCKSCSPPEGCATLGVVLPVPQNEGDGERSSSRVTQRQDQVMAMEGGTQEAPRPRPSTGKQREHQPQ